MRGRFAAFAGCRPTRRGLIAATLAAAAAASTRAEEQAGRVSQTAAAYQDTPKGLFSCNACTFFIRPRSCKVVSGDVSPTGWCKFFDLPD